MKESPSKLPYAENCGPTPKVSYLWLFCECIAAQTVPAHPDFLPRAAASSAAWRFPTVSPHKSSSVPGWMSRQTRRYTHAHSSSLQVHCTTTFCSSLLCTRQAKLHRWSVNLGHYIKTRNEKVWSLQLAVYVVVIHFKSAQGALPQPHVLQSFFICCHLHQFLWNRRE